MNQHPEASPDDRIVVLKQRTREAYSSDLFDFRKAIAERVFSENLDEPQSVKVALVLERFQREKPLVIFEEDVLAGYCQDFDFTMPGIERFSSNCPPRKNAPGRPWEHRLSEQVRGGFVAGLYSTCPGAHHIAGYERVLARGYGALAQNARQRLDTATGDARDFARASLIACESATRYALRYAEAYERLCADAPIDRRKDLQRIPEACRWVATEPPRSFFEALQLLWLTHETIHCEQARGSLSLGRIDVYLLPWYERDLAAGRITKEGAQELMDALWVKFGALPQGFQHVTIGGLDKHKRYVANDLTFMALRATRRVRMDQPLLGLRWHPTIPEPLWKEVQEVLMLGTGFPALFNDEICIQAKVRMGIPREEAVDFGLVGCVEPMMPGREFSQTETFRINWLKVLELMLNQGVCPLSGEKLALLEEQDPDSVRTFDEFYAWYKRELLHALDIGAEGMNVITEDYHKFKPTPFTSSTVEGCLEKGRDVAAGGTIWNFSTINVTGQANAVDSLVSIKHLVFEEHALSLSQLAEVLRRDFEGCETLCARVMRDYPRFGNDHDEPDAMMADLMAAFHDRLSRHKNPWGEPFQMGLFAAGWHGVLGGLTGASPDGRRARGALANGSSPVQGADTLGPTAVMRSLTKFDHTRAAAGLVLDMKFHPTFFDDASRRAAFQALVETYFALGGLELQVNVVKRETLLDAQLHPENHRDLLVRVSGYSAYFVQIGKVLQDEIIMRTDLAMV
jgi:formate C-acetyltransferase